MTDQRTLKKIINDQRAKIEKFRRIAVHVAEHCCSDCEDTTMCEYGCAITMLKNALDYQSTKERTKLFSNCCDNIEARCCFCGHVYGVLIRLYQGWCCVDCFQSHILQSNKPKQTMEKSENPIHPQHHRLQHQMF